ncbi:MAG: hypothetical protein V4548_12240 [Bacteroidota bacterium]
MNIKFNEEQKQYLLNEKWTSEIDETYFEDKIYKLKIQLQSHLKIGNNNKQFLNELLENLWNEYERYNYKSYKLTFIGLIKAKIKIDSNNERKPAAERYNHDFIKNFQYDIDIEDSDYVYHFQRYSAETKNYEDILDFEKVKLLYSIDLFVKSLSDFYSFVYSLEMNLDFIDFDKLMAEPYTFSDKTQKIKCHINLKKIELAQLFTMLMSMEYLFMDKTNPNKNKILMEKFIEDNFTYKNHEDKQLNINYLKREFTELNWHHLDNQVNFIDGFILNLEKVKDEIRRRKIRDTKFSEPTK